jgi:prepilin peptidase CpaA
MTATQTIWALTLAVTIYAGWIDWRVRRIPNWLTVPSLFLGIALHASIAGWRGALTSIEGVGLALALLLPLVLMRALGAGDWKLMGAVGAFLGPWMFVLVLLASVFVSGFMAMALMIHAKRVKQTLRNVIVLVKGFFAFGLRAHPEISLDNPTLLKLPFGVATAMGTAIMFVVFQWGLY